MSGAIETPGTRLGSRRRSGIVGWVQRALAPPSVGEPGSREWRAFRRFALMVPLANLAGAIDLFGFWLLVLPLPPVHDAAQLQALNLILFAVYMPVSFCVAGAWTKKIAMPMVRWLNEDRPPNDRELMLVLHHPFNQLRVNATMWAGAAVVFGALNAAYSLSLGAVVAVTIVFGGLTTCALVYLFSERLLRPITARALATRAPSEPTLPGVAARVLLPWAFTTAVPLLGAVMLGVLVVSGTHVTQTRLALTVIFLSLLVLTAGLAAMAVAARSLADPLKSVRAALARVEEGDLDVEVAVDDGSEVGLLQAGFNRMVAGLRESELLRDLFGRQVGEEVAREALQRGVELGGEVREAAILFVDIIGSTTIAGERPPAEVVGLLNRFFALVVDVVRKHGGWINKFEGDGALCVFGAPVELDDPAGASLAAARELDARLRVELPELEVAIGVSAGPVVAGNVGASERFEYTVVGDAVNEAARLTELAKTMPGHVLASGRALRAAGGVEPDCWQTDGARTLRGRAEPTELATPTPTPA